ncbi:MAG: hypothetical protein AAF851_16030 [Myxococcota bacterium]
MSERHGRQLVLSGWTPELQARLAAMKAVVPERSIRSEVCALYLVGAGVGALAADSVVGEACRRLNPRLRLEAPPASAPSVALGGVELPRIDTGDPVGDGAAEAAALLEAYLK